MWDGAERRERGGETASLIVYRLDQAEKKLDALEKMAGALNSGIVEMRVEMTHVAKDAGKTSGALSGVATGIIMAVIGFALQSLLGIKAG